MVAKLIRVIYKELTVNWKLIIVNAHKYVSLSSCQRFRTRKRELHEQIRQVLTFIMLVLDIVGSGLMDSWLYRFNHTCSISCQSCHVFRDPRVSSSDYPEADKYFFLYLTCPNFKIHLYVSVWSECVHLCIYWSEPCYQCIEMLDKKNDEIRPVPVALSSWMNWKIWSFYWVKYLKVVRYSVVLRFGIT